MKEKGEIILKIVLAFILGLILAGGGVYAVNLINARDIDYSNSKLSSDNVQGAIDELYEKVDIGKSINKAGKFVVAYTYSESGSNQCIMGNEVTCQKNTCYETKTTGSCPAGTIILYKVNDTNIVGFNVLFDEGSTMTMQSQRKIVANMQWISKEDYVSAGGTDYGSTGKNDNGPLTILKALENATSSWSNVNDQTYSLETNTGCSTYNSCIANTYTLGSRTGKARMISVEEAVAYGCPNNICKKFMTANGKEYYWTSSADSLHSSIGWYVNHDDSKLSGLSVIYTPGARAVVEVSK